MANNRVERALLLLMMAFLLIDATNAVMLHGKIYDIGLNELNNVVVEVNSSPRQRFVSKDGGYAFDLNSGKYLLTANYSTGYLEYTVAEEISVAQEGDYVYDLFLLPTVEDDELLKSLNVETGVVDLQVDTVVVDKKKALWAALTVLAAVILLLIAYFFIRRHTRKKQKAELAEVDRAEKTAKDLMSHKPVANTTRKKAKYGDEVGADDMGTDLEQVVDIIRKEGGRTTQKELRKQIPLSEAKISLMIAELEHKGILQKVKKGRGNLLILKK